MYGLIHLSFRSFVRERLGNSVWEQVVKQRELTEEAFVSMSGYSDNITIGMISAAAHISGKNFNEILEQFGRYWIDYMSNSEYAAMMSFAGSDLIAFISSINDIHKAVNETIEGTKTPTFDILKVSDKVIIIRYKSERSGLLPFVIGLLKGLFEKFNVSGTIAPKKAGKKSLEIKISLS